MPDWIVDAHHHFFDVDQFAYPWMVGPAAPLDRNHLPEHLEPHLTALGVQRTVLVQGGAEPNDTAWFLELAEKHEFIGGVVGWVDLRDPEVGKRLDELAKHPKFKGVRHVVEDEPDVDWLIREDVLRGLSELARLDIPYDLLVDPRHLHCMRVIAERVPGLRMVIDHIAKPPIAEGLRNGWARDMAEFAGNSQIYVKLSGMITEADWSNWKPSDLAPYVSHVVEHFGYERVMFGSDWPVCLLAGSYEQVFKALVEALGPLSDEDRKKVFGRNACRFYGIA